MFKVMLKYLFFLRPLREQNQASNWGHCHDEPEATESSLRLQESSPNYLSFLSKDFLL